MNGWMSLLTVHLLVTIVAIGNTVLDYTVFYNTNTVDVNNWDNFLCTFGFKRIKTVLLVPYV